jgi:group I intron endonuclease
MAERGEDRFMLSIIIQTKKIANMSIYSIYLIRNKVNQKCYVGYTSQKPEARWKQHINISKHPERPQYKRIHMAFVKYGIENFDFSTICQSKDKNYALSVLEPMFILQYNSFECGYNSTLGGEINPPITEETRKKMSESGKKKILTDEHKEKLRIARMTNKRVVPLEERVAISLRFKGKPKSEESKEKMRIAQSKVIRTEQYEITFPCGKVEIVNNVTKFCRDNPEYELMVQNLIMVSKGKRKHHKNFKCKKL